MTEPSIKVQVLTGCFFYQQILLKWFAYLSIGLVTAVFSSSKLSDELSVSVSPVAKNRDILYQPTNCQTPAPCAFNNTARERTLDIKLCAHQTRPLKFRSIYYGAKEP